MSFSRILIAVDGSAFAAHAAEVGVELSKRLAAEVAFIHVIDPAIARGGPEVGVPVERMVALEEQEAKSLLVAFQERAALTPAALGFVEIGHPAAKIVESAKNWPADLIVIGSHGRGGVGRLLLGSVAESVIRHAGCPVLVVRAPK